MASNPMQRKVRNSFFLGILVMLIITILIGTIVFFMVIKPKMDLQIAGREQLYVNAYKLKDNIDVKSGEEIDISMLEKVEIPVSTQTVSTDFIDLGELTKDLMGENGEIYTINRFKSKVDLTGGTILTYSMLYEEKMNDSLRYVEYNMITMPTTLDLGSYIDIRLRLPNGQDLVVVSKKEIKSIYGQTIGLYLTEEEILILNSAIVEAYIMPSAELYMATYVEPGLQTAAVYTYMPTNEVITLINMDGNIVQEAKSSLAALYNKQEVANVRNQINASSAQYSTSASDNIEEGMKEQIEAAKKAREDYLSELEGY